MVKSSFVWISIFVLVALLVVAGYLYISKPQLVTYSGEVLKIDGGKVYLTTDQKVADYPINLELGVKCTSQDLRNSEKIDPAKVQKEFAFPIGENLGAFLPQGTYVFALSESKDNPLIHTFVVPQNLCASR